MERLRTNCTMCIPQNNTPTIHKSEATARSSKRISERTWRRVEPKRGQAGRDPDPKGPRPPRAETARCGGGRRRRRRRFEGVMTAATPPPNRGPYRHRRRHRNDRGARDRSDMAADGDAGALSGRTLGAGAARGGPLTGPLRAPPAAYLAPVCRFLRMLSVSPGRSTQYLQQFAMVRDLKCHAMGQESMTPDREVEP
jgi:hypothetical protein